MAGRRALMWVVTGIFAMSLQVIVAAPAEKQVKSKNQLQQKLTLVERMLFQSPLGEQASKALSDLPPPVYEAWLEASQAFELAMAELKNHNNDAADKSLNTALAHYRQASLLNRQSSRPQMDYSVLAKDIKERIQSYRESLDRISQEKAAQPSQSLGQIEIDELIASAENFERQGDVEQAVRILQSLQSTLENELMTVRSGETLVSSIVFESLDDAFEYEVKKSESNETLLELLLNNKSISKDNRLLVKNDLQESRDARSRAIRHHEQGDIKLAVQILEKATAIQTRAIRLFGVKM